jgi:hypothetical protein
VSPERPRSLTPFGLCLCCHLMRHICYTTDICFWNLQPEADPCNCHLKVYVHPELLKLPEWKALRRDLGPENFDTIGTQGPLSSNRITPGSIGSGLHGFMSDGPLGDNATTSGRAYPAPSSSALQTLSSGTGPDTVGPGKMMPSCETLMRICTASRTPPRSGEGAGRSTCM